MKGNVKHDFFIFITGNGSRVSATDKSSKITALSSDSQNSILTKRLDYDSGKASPPTSTVRPSIREAISPAKKNRGMYHILLALPIAKSILKI